jgi:hypothetical protein
LRRSQWKLYSDPCFAGGDETFDERPTRAVDSEALEFRAASESLDPIRWLTRNDLGTLRLATEYHERCVPAAAGIPLFVQPDPERRCYATDFK